MSVIPPYLRKKTEGFISLTPRSRETVLEHIEKQVKWLDKLLSQDGMEACQRQFLIGKMRAYLDCVQQIEALEVAA